jgi:hypothetical protein
MRAEHIITGHVNQLDAQANNQKYQDFIGQSKEGWC